MIKLPDNRLLVVPLHHSGINSRSRKAYLKAAFMCVLNIMDKAPTSCSKQHLRSAAGFLNPVKCGCSSLDIILWVFYLSKKKVSFKVGT